VTEHAVAKFEALILPHLDSAYTFARYILRDEHDAQDAVQEAALRAFRGFSSYRGGDPRSWLLVIVRNVCFTSIRRHRGEQLTPLPHDSGTAALIEPRSADESAIAESDATAIREAVASLPVEFREVIILRELQGLSYAEIGKIVGVPLGTVMSRLSRGRRGLSQRLAHLARGVG
jgi:RNA polymerase sigma-70 factor (ECF subfamily)